MESHFSSEKFLHFALGFFLNFTKLDEFSRIICNSCVNDSAHGFCWRNAATIEKNLAIAALFP